MRAIADGGPLPFARFMELALYDPEHGYYESAAGRVGREGDFFTSVSVGPLFGELLAVQFAEWLAGPAREEPGRPLQLVECGAHDGRLAADILGWLHQQQPDLGGQITYVIVEPSARRREWQQRGLREFSGAVKWFGSLGEAGHELGGINGVIFGNELLDAFPVRRVGWDAAARHWFEWGVDCEREALVWRRLEGVVQPDFGLELPPELLATLPDGFTTEWADSAAAWWRLAATELHAGWLLALDYGLTAEEFLLPGRRQGTLRAYAAHRQPADLLDRPGRQDLTAHVNWSLIQSAGEQAGLATRERTSQAALLTRALERWVNTAGNGFALDAPRRRQFQTLTHPEHLGRKFQVLVQERRSSI